jgi:hypothetical protein
MTADMARLDGATCSIATPHPDTAALLAGRGDLQRRLSRFLRSLYRVCQVMLILGPLGVTLPFMYITRHIFPALRRA